MRKTVSIKSLIEYTNHRTLISLQDERINNKLGVELLPYMTKEFRSAQQSLLEHILSENGVYAGFDIVTAKRFETVKPFDRTIDNFNDNCVQNWKEDRTRIVYCIDNRLK